MDYAKLIQDTLTPLGLPIKETMYTGTASAYIVFDCYSEMAAATAANKPVERGYGFMINLFQQNSDTSVDINDLKERAIARLENAGFSPVIARNRTGLETQYFRWLIDCSYTNNLQTP